MIGGTFYGQDGYDEVIHIDCEPPFFDKVLEYRVGHGLESAGGIAKPKQHDDHLVKPSVGEECCLPYVILLDKDVVVTVTNVEFCELVASPQSVHELGDKG